eukprot:CAMPEP_0175081302 /NCGR_PEP_ID=MMETSP0052_2-20121109/26060_1 /TAXON_ID=51329 ORGANISM="Polytomella parva, Strain SAG 63-3" /NCGR_SAMPLE_ID=MMETSP0052_2 /ASSEMBLY_ACC=CAM_ASM_000194 /LENGTH=66 /DNA_ID=CAMNT_0016352243 /DNA_START=281 /DNA_END=478 /DNA_ORIENTATION=+
MRNGIVQDWEAMTLIWDHALEKGLGLQDTQGLKILLTDPANNPRSIRRRMLEIMFERYGFDSALLQ